MNCAPVAGAYGKSAYGKVIWSIRSSGVALAPCNFYLAIRWTHDTDVMVEIGSRSPASGARRIEAELCSGRLGVCRAEVVKPDRAGYDIRGRDKVANQILECWRPFFDAYHGDAAICELNRAAQIGARVGG